MEKINKFIAERLSIGSNIKDKDDYNYFPKTKEELQIIIKERINKEGPECDLNDIYTGDITDMSNLFYLHNTFNGDISEWDVSNVTNMDGMFGYCTNFNCDISDWDVGNVTNMHEMFYECKKFNQNLGDWDVGNVINMGSMFWKCVMFNQDIAGWDVSNVTNMSFMFVSCVSFDQDLSKWKINGDMESVCSMFEFCRKFEGKNLEDWYISEYAKTNDMFHGCKSAPSWYKNK